MPSDNSISILDDIINNFNIAKFEDFFRLKNETYIPEEEELTKSLLQLSTREYDNFENIKKIGEMQCNNSDEIVVVTCFVKNQLTERSSKKAQYLIGKRILRYLERYTGGFFIFYDSNGSFRFSFIYCLPQADGKLKWNNFRRYTYFVSKDQTNKTFKQQIGQASFDTISLIIDAFSVAKVTKEFYKEIVQLYNILITDSKIGIQKYPHNDDKEKEEFGVRLIGRLLFCWFLKKKKDGKNNAIITDQLLSSKIVDKYNDFLHELLEPLFFQVLNTPLEERMDIYKQEPWNKIPFLNGGLFEPHESDYYQPNCLGISQNINIVRVDNSWFKNVFKLFEQYNFTIDENSTVDAEISIDPEMLGRIFENLLAEINPETGESARKLTGSYYTPREIVEYMVNESLRRYLIEKTCLDEETIDKLLQYDDEDIELTQEQIDKIIDALDEIKVIDPACGSGAFPMGVLHKMVSILQKVDPKSTKWLGKKINQIPDPLIRQELEQKIKGENWDYIHKLGIIQNSIYGVDIQPIATEISKLRFFLSLIVDESIDDNKPNRGIIPLPNLEFKFVTANSLIKLEESNTIAINEGQTIEKIINKMRSLREEYFVSYGKRKKEIENEFKELQNSVYQKSIEWSRLEGQQLQLSEWDPFSFKASKWFDPEWMFGVKDGFDIVIGNPPYIQVKKGIFSNNLFPFSEGKDKGKQNLYKVFVEHSYNLLKENGISCMIVQSSLMCDISAQFTRELLLTKTEIKEFVEIPKKSSDPDGQVFESVLQGTCIFLFKKKLPTENHIFKISINNNVNTISNLEFENVLQSKILKLYPNGFYIPLVKKGEIKIIEKIRSKTLFFSEFIDRISQGDLNLTSEKDYFGKTLSDVVLVRGKNVHRYFCDDNFSEFIKENHKQDLIKENSEFEFLICQQITGTTDERRLHFSLNPARKHLLGNSINKIKLKDKNNNKIFLGILNSNLLDWFFRKTSTNNHVNGYEIEQLPIPKITEENESIAREIETLVDKILTAKKQNPQVDTNEWEREIDRMVYNLYGLTEDEVRIVEFK